MDNKMGFTQGGAGMLTGVRRPLYLSSATSQTITIVRDASGSMTGAKASDATAATVDLVDELAKPENKDGFRVAIVDFAERASVVQAAIKATALVGQVKALDTSSFGAMTNITEGLSHAATVIEQAASAPAEGRIALRPVALLYSDGCHNRGNAPHAQGDRVKAVADLVTVAFGGDADEQLLKQLSTSPQHFYRVKNGRELRMFLATVGKTLTSTMARGTNATVALSRIHT